jgi:hypothetical protein
MFIVFTKYYSPPPTPPPSSVLVPISSVCVGGGDVETSITAVHLYSDRQLSWPAPQFTQYTVIIPPSATVYTLSWDFLPLFFPSKDFAKIFEKSEAHSECALYTLNTRSKKNLTLGDLGFIGSHTNCFFCSSVPLEASASCWRKKNVLETLPCG